MILNENRIIAIRIKRMSALYNGENLIVIEQR